MNFETAGNFMCPPRVPVGDAQARNPRNRATTPTQQGRGMPAPPEPKQRPSTVRGKKGLPSDIQGYKMLQELGTGAFSTVYKAESGDGEIFAIKIVPKSNLANDEDCDRFQRELDSMAYLRHPNIVQLHDFFSDSDNFYLVLDYCANGELWDYMVKNGRIQEPTAALLMQQMVSAIAYCHSCGVAHRDLKPQNILIDKFPAVKVSDFGLCGYVEDRRLMNTFCGTPAFCAPECLGRVEYDGRKADVWSCGVILFAMVTGEYPWNLKNQAMMMQQISSAEYTIPKDVSDKAQDLIRKMLQRDPKDRITMEEALQHPWLRIASSAPIVKRLNLVVEPPALPRLQATKLGALAQKARGERQSVNGIVSPFDESGSVAAGEEPGLPSLSRNGSMSLMGQGNVMAPPVARRRMMNPNGLQRRSMNIAERAAITRPNRGSMAVEHGLKSPLY